MDVFPVLTTPRLLLRKIDAADVPSLVKYANNPKIAEQIINIPHPYREPEAVFRIAYVLKGFKNKSRYVFAIILKTTKEMIGEISLHLDTSRPRAQLGYWIGEPFWNKGIATEAVKAILQFGFEKLKLDQIYATCHEHNIASGKVLLANEISNSTLNGKVRLYWISLEEYSVQRSVTDKK